jgi:hypothetical protein
VKKIGLGVFSLEASGLVPQRLFYIGELAALKR